MKHFEFIKNLLEKRKIKHGFLKVNSLSVDETVKQLGIKYSEGLSTLIFRYNDKEFVAILRRDDKNIDSKRLKKVLGTDRVTFAKDEELKSTGFEPGLASPLVLDLLMREKRIHKILIDDSVFEMSKIICGTTRADLALEIDREDLISLIPTYDKVKILVPNPKRQDKKKRILTGDRPTGKLHIGHLLGSLQGRVKFQEEYETFITIVNIHALSDNRDNPEKVQKSIGEIVCDYYASGIDFDKATVFIQSEVPEIHEIFMYLSNFVSLQQLMHNPTLKTEIKQNKMEESTPLGFFVYPIHQVADILSVNADLVPVGKDQAPMIEDSREIARKFNSAYGVNIFGQPQAHFGVEKNVPGIDGKPKMGKSLNNGVYLADTEKELKQKIMSAYTDPNRIHATDPGTIEGNVAFTYHDLFNKNKEEVADLKSRYKKGKVGDVEVKEKLFSAMNEVLTPIRERRREAEGIRSELVKKAVEGSQKVRTIARGIADEMKDAMKIKF